jgi:Ser/Thr protein kinase RdoA (MazF antagonist)
MTVKTEFTMDDFVSTLSMYDLGTFKHSEAIQQGTVQSNYIIHTSQGKFVFRYYETREMLSVLFESELIAHLTAHHFPCPRQLKNKLGAHIGTYHDKPYAIYEFIEGKHIEDPSVYHLQQVIQKAAELQILTRDFHSVYTEDRWNYTPDLCRLLAHQEAARINTKFAWNKYSWLVHELSNLDLPPTLPKGICHCDFHFSNILFQEDEFVALLDFDDANYTYLQFDLVGLMEYWAWPYTVTIFDLDKAREVVGAYMSYRQLSLLEQNHLFDAYKLSILFDCVWYFSRGSADDFYEKQKIDALSTLGRNVFQRSLFE